MKETDDALRAVMRVSGDTNAGRRAMLLALMGSACVSSQRVALAQPAKLQRIGWLAPDADFLGQGARDALSWLGWVDGRNVAIEYRSAGGQSAKLDSLAAELVRLNVDVIVTFGGGVAAARRATSSIPIVMATSQDPVRTGFAASLARPGGNITGVTYLSDELARKRLELAKEVLPKMTRAAVLWEPSHVDAEYVGIAAAAPGVGVQVRSLEIPRPPRTDESLIAMREAVDGGADALMLAPGNFTIAHRRELAEMALKRRLPVFSAWGIFADAGALLTYGPDPLEMARRTAVYVDRILKGAKPETQPIETPTRYELVVNLGTAQALGMTLPQSLLLRADRVIG